MYPLLLCSVITLAVVIDRGFFWLRHRNGRRPELLAELCSRAKIRQQTIPNGKNSDVVARILIEGLESSRSEMSWRMQLAASREVEEVNRYLDVLNTMVSLAPLLGIFGTVLGIIESFQLLGDASLIDPVAASSGLAKALITTAFGLGIAMPSLIAYKIFQSESAKLRFELETHATELELSRGLDPTV